MNRAYSVLTVKAVDEDQRVIRGTATTPTPDRMGDIVEPMGVRFKNPLALLHQHDADRPVGTVKFDKPTKNGITFEARLPVIAEPGPLKDRVDTAWGEVKAGLVRAVSIGFRAIEYTFIEPTGGIRFTETEVLELSLVSVPANADAVISTIKSIDRPLLAASGKEPQEADRPARPGVSGKIDRAKGVVSIKPETRNTTMNIAEQIKSFEDARVTKTARMNEIMEESAEKGETLSSEQTEEYDTLEGEVKSLGEHIKRLRSLEAAKAASAKEAKGYTQDEANEARATHGSTVHATVKAKRAVEKGIIFTRLLGAKYLAYKHGISPIEVAKSKFFDTPEVETILRAPIAAMNSTDSTAAGPLVELTNATNEFIELLRPQTIIGRIPGLRRVPFNIKVPRGTGDPTAYWVGEGKVKPVSSMAFDQVELTFAKVAGIVTQTEELMRFSQPASEGLIRDGLVAAVAYLVDRDFLDPTKAVTDISPASITNGVTPITATGTTADALRADLGSLLDEYEDDNMGGDSLVMVMTRKQAGRIALMRNSLGQREFEGISRDGGTLEGVPVIVSNNIVAANGSPADGGLIVAINASSVMLADDGGVEIDISREASLQMDSSPDSPATGSTTLVSLWQHNMVAIRAERFINWKKARTGAVQYINGAKYA